MIRVREPAQVKVEARSEGGLRALCAWNGLGAVGALICICIRSDVDMFGRVWRRRCEDLDAAYVWQSTG